MAILMAMMDVKTAVTAQVLCISAVTFPVILVHKQRLQVHAKMAAASKTPLQRRAQILRAKRRKKKSILRVLTKPVSL